MDISKTLNEAGLTEGEVKVYLCLLKRGTLTVDKIKKESEIHRTTIYDFIEKLLNKGLVNYVVMNNVKHFSATNPDKLLDYVEEKEDKIKEILPQLKGYKKEEKEEVIVEVYKGEEGFKTIINDILKFGKDYVIFGVDDSMFQEKFPTLMKIYFNKLKRAGIKERVLTSKQVSFIYKTETTIYRYIPKEFFNPTPTFVWGENVGILIWEPFTIIRIKSRDLADNYRKYFELLWKQASKSRR